MWTKIPKGNKTDGKECSVTMVYDLNANYAKQFLPPSTNLDKAGKVTYPLVKYVKMEFRMGF